MKELKLSKIPIWLLLAILLAIGQPAFAVPTLQVYIVDSTPMDYNGDQDTWVFAGDSSFTLRVVGAYKDGTTLLTEGTLLVSVPEGETVLETGGGMITITPIDPGDSATLLHSREPTGIDSVFNPETYANVDLLTNETGNSDYFDGYYTKDFLPDDITFNNHYPLQNDVSNFLIYDIGNFDAVDYVHNYNADTSDDDYEYPPPLTNTLGEEKDFTVTVSGFSWVHFDAYGYELIDSGFDSGPVKNLVSTWDINSGSHDATWVPAPGAILMGGIGVFLVGWLRRRRTL